MTGRLFGLKRAHEAPEMTPVERAFHDIANGPSKYVPLQPSNHDSSFLPEAVLEKLTPRPR